MAVDVRRGKEKWRTGFKTLNNAFLVHGDYIIGGYGFTAEPSALNILRKKDGRLLRKTRLKTRSFPGGNHDHLRIEPGNVLRVGVYEHFKDLKFSLNGLGAGRPSLRYLGSVAPLKASPRKPPTRKPPPRHRARSKHVIKVGF